MHNTEDNRFMTTSEVARMLNIHVNTVRRWSGLGIIKSHRIGPRCDRRFARDDVVHFLTTEQNENNGPEIEKDNFSEGANNNGTPDCS